jgi:hypothetical protein
MSLGFTANRQMTADVLGVSEKDVFRFKQSSDVMRQLSGAVGEISKNAPQLAYTTAQFKILQYNMLAVASDIAGKLTPSLNGLAIVLDKLLNVLSASKISAILSSLSISTIRVVFGNVAADLAEQGMSILSAIGGSGKQSLGNPQTFMHQLQVGSFEKMGLVVGSGGKMMDYARRTAVGVEKLVSGAAKMKGNAIPRGYSSVFNPASNMP